MVKLSNCEHFYFNFLGTRIEGLHWMSPPEKFFQFVKNLCLWISVMIRKKEAEITIPGVGNNLQLYIMMYIMIILTLANIQTAHIFLHTFTSEYSQVNTGGSLLRKHGKVFARHTFQTNIFGHNILYTRDVCWLHRLNKAHGLVRALQSGSLETLKSFSYPRWYLYVSGGNPFSQVGKMQRGFISNVNSIHVWWPMMRLVQDWPHVTIELKWVCSPKVGDPMIVVNLFRWGISKSGRRHWRKPSLTFPSDEFFLVCFG